MSAQGGVYLGGFCPGGSVQGVSAQGCLPGGCLPGVVSAQGGWGCLPKGNGGVCGRHPQDQRQTPPCEQNNR